MFSGDLNYELRDNVTETRYLRRDNITEIHDELTDNGFREHYQVRDNVAEIHYVWQDNVTGQIMYLRMHCPAVLDTNPAEHELHTMVLLPDRMHVAQPSGQTEK